MQFTNLSLIIFKLWKRKSHISLSRAIVNCQILINYYFIFFYISKFKKKKNTIVNSRFITCFEIVYINLILVYKNIILLF